MLKIGISILAGVLLAAGASAEPLIRESEARLPPANAVATRAITRGPGIRVLSPEAGSPTVTSPFQLRIAFEPRGGAKIDTATVKVTYLRTPNVDLTERVKVGLTEKGIDLKSAEVPPGEHQIRVTVEDSEGRQSSALINLTVTK